jgi:hypothetical protein
VRRISRLRGGRPEEELLSAKTDNQRACNLHRHWDTIQAPSSMKDPWWCGAGGIHLMTAFAGGGRALSAGRLRSRDIRRLRRQRGFPQALSYQAARGGGQRGAAAHRARYARGCGWCGGAACVSRGRISLQPSFVDGAPSIPHQLASDMTYACKAPALRPQSCGQEYLRFGRGVHVHG